MSDPKRNQPPLVSTEAANRIRSFAHDLVTLCRQYEVEIIWRDSGHIEVIDGRRTCYPSGYECDAVFAGCNGYGIFQSNGLDGYPGTAYTGIHIEDLQPCDWYVAEAKR